MNFCLLVNLFFSSWKILIFEEQKKKRQKCSYKIFPIKSRHFCHPTIRGSVGPWRWWFPLVDIIGNPTITIIFLLLQHFFFLLKQVLWEPLFGDINCTSICISIIENMLTLKYQTETIFLTLNIFYLGIGTYLPSKTILLFIFFQSSCAVDGIVFFKLFFYLIISFWMCFTYLIYQFLLVYRNPCQCRRHLDPP